jgi:hypothetical protein
VIPEKREVLISQELEKAKALIEKLKGEHSKVSKELESKKLKELEIEEQETLQYLNRKKMAEKRYMASKEYEELVRKGEIGGSIDTWEIFYKKYLLKHED